MSLKHPDQLGQRTISHGGPPTGVSHRGGQHSVHGFRGIVRPRKPRPVTPQRRFAQAPKQPLYQMVSGFRSIWSGEHLVQHSATWASHKGSERSR